MDNFEPNGEQDPKKPLPGETYTDYWRRLQKENAEQNQNPAEQEYWNGVTDYGRGTNGDPNYGPIPEEYRMNGMSKAAFACGIASLVAILFSGSLFFGALGILFALLSRKEKFSRQARVALWMSAAGIAAFVLAMTISVITLVRSGIWASMMEKLQNMDPNNPLSVTEIEQELLEEILQRYQVTGSAV